VQEFHVSVTRKFGLGRRDARQLVADLCELPLIVVTPQEILRALQLETQHMVSFWDALILSAAETAGAQVVLSEDFTHDRTYGALRVVNPFLT
jgi:predicted nucleic acid-binding protein